MSKTLKDELVARRTTEELKTLSTEEFAKAIRSADAAIRESLRSVAAPLSYWPDPKAVITIPATFKSFDLMRESGLTPTTTGDRIFVATTKGKTGTTTMSGTDWTLVESVLKSKVVRTAYLWGMPGIGKTYAAYNMLPKAKGEVFAITLTEETPAAEIRGHFIFKGMDSLWHDGPAVRAMRAGARLVINEITHASPDVLSFLMPILESVETARITLPSGETVYAAPGFQVIATDNTEPGVLPFALQDRFDISIQITEPHPDACAKHGKAASFVRQACAVTDQKRRISLRQADAFERLRKEHGDETAAKLVWGGRGTDVLYSWKGSTAPRSR